MGAANAPIHVALVGAGGVGKSSIVLQFTRKMFSEEYDPTIMNSYQHTLVVDGHPANLEILDTAGQEEYNAICEQYMDGNDGFLVVFSVEDKESYEAVPGFQKQLARVHDNEEFPMLLVGNKCDVDESRRKISLSEATERAESYNSDYFDVSAKTKQNIDEAFADL
eukprot:Awhi_evm1s13521